MTDVPVLLSCEQCKRRKTKCDKTFPRCSACRAANINCRPVQRSRLPRGRTGNVKHKGFALADKIARLESLVGRLEAQIQDNENASASVSAARQGSETDGVRATSRVEDLIAKDFWIALSKEVTGLRETLESTDGEDIQQRDMGTHEHQSGVQNTSNLLLFNQGSELPKHTDTYITQSSRTILIQTYRDRIDILFKVTHWPTVTKMLQSNYHSDVASGSNIASIALQCCICFTAATTLSDQDCEELRLGPKNLLVEHYRRSAESTLSQSNLLIEPTFSTIQAFTIYLMGLRTSGQGALTWTLIALAIRLANIIDLGSETNNRLSALDIEQRRRVWFAIGLLDSQAAFGRGSVPLLSHTDLKHLPLNINDAEVGLQTVSTHSLTEMSFSCVTHQALLCQRKLCDPFTPSFHDRAEIVASFESAMQRDYLHLETSDIPLEKYTALLAKDVAVNMQLLLLRPPYRSASFDINQPPSDTFTFDILTTATSILERGLAKQHSSEFRKWSWFAWPRWYALAVVLVELCSVPIKPQTGPNINKERDRDRDRDINRAYTIALQSFNNYAQSASEVTSGTIWTPIVKLMRRVQQLRGNPNDHSAYLNPETTPTVQPSYHTILARYCDALSDFKTDTTFQQSMIETNPDLLWDAFLEDLGETTVTNTSASASASAPFPTTRQVFDTTTTTQTATTATNDSTSPPPSTWSLIPYVSILPRLHGGFPAGPGAQGQGQRDGQMGRTVQTGQARRTAMEDGREGNSVLGAIVL